jgi:uncharacterized protein
MENVRYKIYLFLVIFLILSGCTNKSKLEINTREKSIVVNVEIADTDEERKRGLMFRKSLGTNDGMLFIFEREEYVAFWMKNTFIPLDMIFISSNGTINEIKENIQPCLAEPCEIYKSIYPVKYVLEVNANFSRNNNISVGDKVKFLFSK